MLILYTSPTSPFARKVIASAHVLGVFERLTLVQSAPHPVDRDPRVVAANPLGKVPTLILEDGTTLFDSRVIVEYLATLVPGQSLLPERGRGRFTALRQQALGDGLLDAALLLRYEALIREESERSPAWIRGQFEKIDSALATIEAEIDALAGPLTLGTITYAAALGFLDFRLPDHHWRRDHPRTAAWFAEVDALPPLAETRPRAPAPQPVAASR